MAKIKYDVRDVEPSRSFDVPIPVGVYLMVISNAVKRLSKEGNDMLEIEMEVAKGEHKGRKVWEYIVLDDSSEWKVRQLIDALGEKLKGTIDTDKLIGKAITIKTKHDSFERENDETGDNEIVVTSKVASLLKLKKSGEDTEEEKDAEAEDEEEEEPEAAGDEETEETEEEESEDYTWDDLAEMDRAALKEFKKENEADTKITKGKSDDAIREELAEEFGIEKPEEAEDEEEEPEEEEEEADEESGYDDMTMPELKEDLKGRGLKVAGTKKALIKRLEKDDAKSTKKGASKKKDEPF